MRLAGVIAEYNPFHRGHAYQLAQLRRAGFTHIAVVMGGNFLQRGSPAVCDKALRAEMALRSGADLVTELPLGWACAPAQRFAAGGVALLDALGCDALAFGGETGDLSLLQKAARADTDPEVSALTRQLLEQGVTYAAARQQAVAQVFSPALAEILSQPNNILGVAYLQALESQHSAMQPLVLQRVGAAHDAAQSADGFASASRIRQLLYDGNTAEAFSLLPDVSRKLLGAAMEKGRAPADLSRVDMALLAKLRTMSKEDFAALPDLSEGLENRLYTAARAACSAEEFLALAKTKRYTLARIRRLMLAAFLDVRRQELSPLPPYVRVLGFTAAGQEILSRARRKNALPVSHSLARLEELGGDCARTARLEARSGDLYSLMLPHAAPCGSEYTRKIISL